MWVPVLGWSLFASMVPEAGIEPARPLRAEGFSYHFGFRRRRPRAGRIRPAGGVRGLEHAFILALRP